MRCIVRLLPCFAILPLLLSAPLRAGGGSWIGKQVMPKQTGIRLWYADDKWQHVSVGNFEDMIVPVLGERSEWLKVRHLGMNAWFAREDAVLLEDAVAYFTEKLRANADDVYAHIMRAEARHAKGQRDGSIEDYSEAIRLRPKNAGLHGNRGLLYLETKDYDRAIGDFDEAIRLDPKSVSAFSNRAFAYTARGDYDRAIQDCDEAIHLDPHDAVVWNYRGAACFKKGDYNRAISDYREAIRLDPRSVRSYCNRGLAWLGRKEYERAIKDFDTATRLEPAYAPPYNHLARIAATSAEERLRDGGRAMHYARKACELTAWKDAGSLDSLAAACAECGRFAEAVQWQQKGIELGYPDEQSAAEARQRLQLYAEQKPFRIAAP